MVLYDNDVSRHRPDRAPTLEGVEVNGAVVRVLESCHSLWIFEPDRCRFRRVPRGTRLDMPSAENEWTPYHRLELDPASGGFSVGLNAQGTRVLRSWLHGEPCRHCDAAGDHTGELSVESLRQVMEGPAA